ncbi:hypothetical protein M8C21_025741 [Ambrosia artemisiifolia]|uniref:Uncharacterized protein n=1 Tax=Ambrosia artemisiifolia TaxID=4212 RepID=A0AAD5C495_AMBAR|nr:hypothetical protein M8C21_025741 [Ambrosia artemisiifolia]
MKTTFDTRGVGLLLAINLIIHNVLQADSTHDQGTLFSGRNRMLRKLPLAPPPPMTRSNPLPKPKPSPPPPPSSHAPPRSPPPKSCVPLLPPPPSPRRPPPASAP